MEYVCKTLSAPDLTGHQTCESWVAYEQSNGFFPDLTAEQRDSMGMWFVGIFAVVFGVRMIRRLFGI
jgi:hypothetical protein